MSITDDFYSNFPSLNSNSKETQRYKRISEDYSEYLKNFSPKSPKQTKKQQRRSRIEKEVVTELFEREPSLSGSSVDVIFSSEERNESEERQKEAKRKSYQESLQKQIQESKERRRIELEKRKRDEELLEKRLQRQLESIRFEHDPQSEKVVERISLSENEKDNLKQNTSISSDTSSNKVYRYFSQSARRDPDLFNYQRLFSDIIFDRKKQELDSIEHKKRESLALKLMEPLELMESPQQSSQNTLKKSIHMTTPKKKPQIDKCTHAECCRCRKKFEMYCNECNELVDKVTTTEVTGKPTNHPQIEYIEPELPFALEQQVVVYRPSEQKAPYSFNIEPDSVFYKNTLEDLRRFSEAKFANYLKHYGELRKMKLQSDLMSRIDKNDKIDEPVRKTGTIPKQILREETSPEQILTTDQTDLDEILNSNAQYTVITQVGFAKKHLEQI